MTEATKELIKGGVIGDLKYRIYEITNAANAETVTTDLNNAFAWFGCNETTADKVFGASMAISSGVAVLTLLLNTTTDELRIMVVGQ
ncbi:hypothetical protein M0R04_11165 [Candidatus Dojkabacteria bacterium]|jgi:hypothetical protein|nr:hypothetical protein [Candidatus Dojkabacteria bacterium]